MKAFAKLPLLVLLIASLSVGGVYATAWVYDTSYNLPDRSHVLLIDLGAFEWTGSEVLPDDVEGENHKKLIANLLEGTDASGYKYGLNNPDAEINDLISNRQKGGLLWSKKDTFGSVAVTGGAEMGDLFNSETENLTFLIHMKSDTEWYIYTTDVYLGERGEISTWGTNKTPGKPTTPIGQYISPIYQTKIVRANKNSPWAPENTVEGKAKSAWYEESRRNENATQIPSFDPDTFVETTE